MNSHFKQRLATYNQQWSIHTTTKFCILMNSDNFSLSLTSTLRWSLVSYILGFLIFFIASKLLESWSRKKFFYDRTFTKRLRESATWEPTKFLGNAGCCILANLFGSSAAGLAFAHRRLLNLLLLISDYFKIDLLGQPVFIFFGAKHFVVVQGVVCHRKKIFFCRLRWIGFDIER